MIADEHAGLVLSSSGRTVIGCEGDPRHLDIPEGVEEIAPGAFRKQPVRRVSLPSTLRVIGEGAFEGTHLERVVIPAAVERIGERAFSRCGSWADHRDGEEGATVYIEVEEGNARYRSERGSLIEDDSRGGRPLSLHYCFDRALSASLSPHEKPSCARCFPRASTALLRAASRLHRGSRIGPTCCGYRNPSRRSSGVR